MSSLILRFGPSPALQSRDKGPLRINLEPLGLTFGRRQASAFRPESRKVDSRWHRAVLGMVLLAAGIAAFFTTAVQAQPVPPADRWTFSVTPYLWLPTIDSTLKYQAPPGSGGGPEVQVGPVDYLELVPVGRCDARLPLPLL